MIAFPIEFDRIRCTIDFLGEKTKRETGSNGRPVSADGLLDLDRVHWGCPEPSVLVRLA